MALKKPLTYQDQVKKLKDHGILVENEVEAETVLAEINYYRLTGYSLQFRVSPSDSRYKENIKFEKLCQIYRFDKELRTILRKHIEKVEVFYRTKISYGFSHVKCKEPPHDQHYDENNFYNKASQKSVIDRFIREQDNYYQDSLIVKHHKAKYMNKMPLWVMVELMSFSNVSKLYSSMYNSEQNTIANNLGINSATLRNHLHCLSVLRNRCAHAARLYNTEFKPPVVLNYSFSQRYPEIKNDSLFAYILILIKRLPKKEYAVNLVSEVIALIEGYKSDIDLNCIGFPGNYEDILKKQIR